MNLPEAIPVKALLEVNSEYCGSQIDEHDALYEGGTTFRSMIHQFLIKRKLETSKASPNFHEQYLQRVTRAAYINRAGGTIDWITAALLKGSPHVEVGEEASDEQREYWEGLNTNADGLGSNLTEIFRRAFIDMLVHRRPALELFYPSPELHPANSKSTTGFLSLVTAKETTDWKYKVDGSLDWLRTHTMEYIRPDNAPWEQPDRERHVWTFYTSEETEMFEATWDKDQPPSEKLNATRFYYQPHSLGRPPVWEIKVGKGQWVMFRIYDAVKALFNREAAMDWHLDMSAYAQPVLKTDKDMAKIYSSELLAIHLGSGDSFDYASPDSSIYSSQEAHAKYLKESLYEEINALAINAMTMQTQNARQAASAKVLDRDPLQVLLESFAQPLRDAWDGWQEANQRLRGEEDLEVQLVGLGEFTATMEDLRKELIDGEEGSRTGGSVASPGAAAGEGDDLGREGRAFGAEAQ